MTPPPPVTPDGRYIVVRGRLWRRTNPNLPPEERQRLADLINPETLVRLWRTNPARLLDPSPESIPHPPVDNGL